MPFALITGASKGIGRSIAKEFAARKINVLLIARTEKLLDEFAVELKTLYGIEAYYLPIDLGQPNGAKKIYDWCVEKNYTVSFLVNNAGYGLSGDFEKYSSKDYMALMQINIITPVELISFFLPELKKQNKAYILNIGSSAAYQSVPYLSIYAASKAFVLKLSRALKYELRKTNVSVTLISPGPTNTEFPERADVPEKAIKAGKKISMTADQVAKIAVKSLFKEKTEVITGFITKFTIFLVWLLPKKLVERSGASFYKKP